MKRDTYSKTKDDAQVDMTPMLDIVFIMLIFFIVTTTFSNELGLAANKPDNIKSPPESVGLSVNIDANGQVNMMGRLIDTRLIVANTERFLAEHNVSSASVVAHKDTEHGIVVEVMDELKLAGISTVNVLLEKD